MRRRLEPAGQYAPSGGYTSCVYDAGGSSRGHRHRCWPQKCPQNCRDADPFVAGWGDLGAWGSDCDRLQSQPGGALLPVSAPTGTGESQSVAGGSGGRVVAIAACDSGTDHQPLTDTPEPTATATATATNTRNPTGDGDRYKLTRQADGNRHRQPAPALQRPRRRVRLTSGSYRARALTEVRPGQQRRRPVRRPARRSRRQRRTVSRRRLQRQHTATANTRRASANPESRQTDTPEPTAADHDCADRMRPCRRRLQRPRRQIRRHRRRRRTPTQIPCCAGDGVSHDTATMPCARAASRWQSRRRGAKNGRGDSPGHRHCFGWQDRTAAATVQPVTGGGRVYVATGSRGVFALDNANGSVLEWGPRSARLPHAGLPCADGILVRGEHRLANSTS